MNITTKQHPKKLLKKLSIDGINKYEKMSKEEFNIFVNNVLKSYDFLIKQTSSSISSDYDQQQDIAQYIRIFLYDRLKLYNDAISLDWFVKNTIYFSYLKFFNEKGKQVKFEDSFFNIEDYNDITYVNHLDETNKLILNIVKNLRVKDQIVFYALLYNVDNKKYYEIAEILNMNRHTFLHIVRKIRNITTLFT